MSMISKIKSWMFPAPMIDGPTAMAMLETELASEAKKYSAGELLPQYMADKPIWKKWDELNAMGQGYVASSWVYSCVSTLMAAASSVEWEAHKLVGGVWEPAPGHPMEQLINNPNPYQTKQTFIETITAHMFLGGNALATKVKVRGVPVELWLHHPGYITPTPSTKGLIDHYKFQRGTVNKKIEPDDAIHWLFTDPETPYWGASPLAVAARQVDTDSEAINWNKVALQNRAITDGVFSVDGPISPKQYEILKDQVREQHQGARNARAPWVLGGGVKWHQMSLSPAEMDFIQSRKLGLVEICSIFKTPPPLIGYYEDATLANIETARLIFWEDTIIPFLNNLKGALNLSLQKDFGRDVELRWNATHISVFLDLLIKKQLITDSLFAKGVPMSVINEHLDLGLPDYPGNNVGYVPAGLTPTHMMMIDPYNGDEIDPRSMDGFDDIEPPDEYEQLPEVE